MIINPNTPIPIYRVESQGRTETFNCLDTAMIFLRSEAKEGKTPLSLSVSTVKHSEYVAEVEAQEKTFVRQN